MKLINRLIFFVIVMVGLISCADKTVESAPKPQKEKTIVEIENELNQLALAMNQLIGDAKCESNDQCQVVEFGSRPCGGPASYKAYSSLNTDVPLLLKTSKAHVGLSKKYNAIKNIVSICSVLTPPQVSCNKTCITQNVNILIQ
ncbi:hypothetical protein MNBD_GAMMA07-280 [hydrothermal vent metagenome]|uniref:Lipoprotein n=1 Tax=hydrothermal vent metagenome TaxID=652676 RepID=A0A3B0XN31_9ZZZZ